MTERVPVLHVVVVAAGQSTRMGGLDKQFALLGDRPVLGHAIDAFVRHPDVASVVVVAAPERVEMVRALASTVAGPTLRAVVPGGVRRQDSVRRGVEAVGSGDLIAIHDGARPFVSADLIERGLAALQRASAAIAVVPVVDTIKRVDEAGVVVETPARATLRAAQTPQFFRLSVLTRAYAAVDWAREWTDEAALVAATGVAVTTFEGDVDTFKITTPRDLLVAEALWRARQAASDA